MRQFGTNASKCVLRLYPLGGYNTLYSSRSQGRGREREETQEREVK